MKCPNRSQRAQSDLPGALGALRQLTKIFLPSFDVHGSAAGRAASIEQEESAMNRTAFMSPTRGSARRAMGALIVIGLICACCLAQTKAPLPETQLGQLPPAPCSSGVYLFPQPIDIGRE